MLPGRCCLLVAASCLFAAADAFAMPAAARAPMAAAAQRPSSSLALARTTPPVALAGGKKSFLPWFLDPGTKGGIVTLSVLGIAAPIFAYQYMLDSLGWDVILAGQVVLVGYVGLGTVAWVASYVGRVANKDMTYAQQLRDYENAVIQKRFEELSEEEVDALMGEIYQPGAEPKK